MKFGSIICEIEVEKAYLTILPVKRYHIPLCEDKSNNYRFMCDNVGLGCHSIAFEQCRSCHRATFLLLSGTNNIRIYSTYISIII